MSAAHENTYVRRVRESFERQGLMRHWGAELVGASQGKVEFALPKSDTCNKDEN